MECLVEHDYAAQEEDELTLTKGDVIKSVVTKMDGWWEGTLHGKRGMFPDNFVKVLTTNSGANDGVHTGSNTEVAQMRKKSDGGPHPRRLKAVFSYAPEQDDELGLEVGDIVNFIAEVEEGWWRGELKDRIGIFPSNFVQDVESVDGGEALTGGQNSDSSQKRKDSNRATVLVKGQGIPDVVPAALTPVSDDEPAPKLPPKPVRETARCFYPYFAQNDDELTLQEGDIVNIISKDCEDEGWFRGELRGKIGLFPDNFVKIITANDPVYTPSSLPSANQPKVTAQERTTGNVSRNDSHSPAGKKERDTPSPAPAIGKLDRDSPSRSNSMNAKSGSTNTVVDGVGKSKPVESKPASTTSSSSFLSKASIFKSNKSKSESFEKKGVAPPTPFSAKIKLDTPPSSPADNLPQSEDFNSISRGEKLSHLTANRAKAPRRRPPSAIISPREEEHGGVTNGSLDLSTTTTTTDSATPEPNVTHTHTHTPLSLRNSSGHSAVTPDDRSSPSKEVSPGPFGSSVNKPKQSLPWMAELKQKQDRKSIISVNSSNNVSNVTVTSPTPSVTLKESTPSPTPPAITTRAPPLPAKPHVPTVPSPTVTEKQFVPNASSHNSSNSNSTMNAMNTTPTTVSPSSAAIPTTTSSTSSVGSKFSYLKRMGASTPATGTGTHTSPAPAISNNHNNSHSASSDTPNVPNSAPLVTNHHNSNANAKDTPEFVPYEEHRKLKEKVTALETELDLVKKQVKLLLERDFGKGHIV